MKYFNKVMLKTGFTVLLAIFFLAFSFISTDQSASACSILMKRQFVESESTIQYHEDGSISGSVLVDEALKNYVYLVIEYPSEVEKSHFVLDTEKAQIKKTVTATPTYHYQDEVFNVNLYEFSFHYTADELNLPDGAYQVKFVASNKDLYVDKTSPLFLADRYYCGLFSKHSEPTTITVANHNWETKYNVPSDKIWTVKFTQDIDPASVEESVKVYEKSSGTPVKTEVTVDGKNVIVKPVEKYKEGNSYILEIQKSIQAVNGKVLKKAVKMEFVIESKDEEVIQIPDAVLEQAIRKALNKQAGDITKKDMLTLTELEVNSVRDDLDQKKELKNLAGIEYASNLTKLSIDNANRVDLNILQSLEKLEELEITRTKNTKFEPIGELEQLKKLTLWRSAVKDIYLVKNLKNLEYLELEYNEIQDITPIEGLTNLIQLNLRSNQVTDISSLRNLTNLKYLVLYTNQITDISVLTELPSLESIGLYENPLKPSSVDVIEALKDKGVRGYYSDLNGYETLKN